TAIEMIDPVHGCFALRGKPGKHKPDTGTQIGRHHWCSLKPLDARHYGRISFYMDMCAHSSKFRYMHETVLEDRFANARCTVRRRHQRHILRLQIGRKSRIGGGGHVDSSRARPLSADPYAARSEEHTSELQSRGHLVCR